MKDILLSTVLGMSLFKDELINSFILHIPHSSTHLPSLDGFILDKVEKNISLLTDHATDKIFDVDGVEKIVTPYSRLFCDVERFEDESEPMFNLGRGFYSTNGYDGSELRELDEGAKVKVYHDYYLKHHERFYKKVKEKLKKHGVAHIIDCHSFNDKPIVPFNYNTKSPDVCIGTDPFHTPKYLLEYTVNYFLNLGYTVEINNPYSGCIIPKPFFKTNNDVKGIMIEINKRLYMENNLILEQEVEHLHKIMIGYFENL